MSPVPAEGLVSLEVVSPGLSLLCVVVGVCCVVCCLCLQVYVLVIVNHSCL